MNINRWSKKKEGYRMVDTKRSIVTLILKVLEDKNIDGKFIVQPILGVTSEGYTVSKYSEIPELSDVVFFDFLGKCYSMGSLTFVIRFATEACREDVEWALKYSAGVVADDFEPLFLGAIREFEKGVRLSVNEDKLVIRNIYNFLRAIANRVMREPNLLYH